MSSKNTPAMPIKFSGYHQPKDRPGEKLVSQVGPGTPAGEYLRHYWHPFELSCELRKRPRVVRVLGEDLVLLRNLSGTPGLVHKHCSHRGMSLEFGIIAQDGIRCADHGWLFANDGTVLETPGEPAKSPLRHKACHGAYPVIEKEGVLFTYMGPPESTPDFPLIDANRDAGRHDETLPDPFAMQLALGGGERDGSIPCGLPAHARLRAAVQRGFCDATHHRLPRDRARFLLHQRRAESAISSGFVCTISWCRTFRRTELSSRT